MPGCSLIFADDLDLCHHLPPLITFVQFPAILQCHDQTQGTLQLDILLDQDRIHQPPASIMQVKLPEKINEHLSRTKVLDLNKDTDGSNVCLETGRFDFMQLGLRINCSLFAAITNFLCRIIMEIL